MNNSMPMNMIDNVDEMNKLLEILKLPKLTQEIENSNGLLSIKEIELKMEGLSKKEKGLMDMDCCERGE